MFQDREPEGITSNPQGLSLTGGDRRRYNRQLDGGCFLFVPESIAVGKNTKSSPKPFVKDGVLGERVEGCFFTKFVSELW